MKSVKANFNKIQEKNPYWSSFVCFAVTTQRKKYTWNIVRYWFNKLVEKDDYARDEKMQIYKWLKQFTILPKKG